MQTWFRRKRFSLCHRKTYAKMDMCEMFGLDEEDEEWRMISTALNNLITVVGVRSDIRLHDGRALCTGERLVQRPDLRD